MARGVFRRSQGYQERALTNPAREWLIGIGLLIVVVITGGVLNRQEYIQYDTLELRSEHSDVVVEQYDYTLAERARTLYIEKKTLFQSLQNNPAATPIVGDEIVATSTEVSAENQTEQESEIEDNPQPENLVEVDAPLNDEEVDNQEPQLVN